MITRQHMLVAACIGVFCCPAPSRAADNDTAEHISYYETLLRRNPYDDRARQQLAVCYHNRAVEYSQQGAWQQAIEDIERARSLDPQERIILNTAAVIFNNYGLLLKDQGKLLVALTHLEQAHAIRPDETQIRENIGGVYCTLAQEKYEKAEYESCRSYLRQAREYAPQNPHICVLAGELAYLHDEYEQAEEYWNEAVTIDSSLTAVRNRLEKLRQDQQLERGFSVRDVGNFKLKFQGSGSMQVASQITDILPLMYRDVGQHLELFPDTLIPLIIYPAQSERPDYFPDWAAGAYDGKIRVRLDGRDSQMLKAVLYHEYTHALIYQLAGIQVPLWLNEGLAEHEARRFLHVNQRKARRQRLLRAQRENALFKIGEQLSGTERQFLDDLTREQIELVYAQSESFVTFLIRKYSLYNLRRVLVRLAEGDSPRKAIEDVLFTDLDALEQAWLKTLKNTAEKD